MPAGYLVHKNAYLLNARFPTEALRDENRRAQIGSAKRPKLTTMYTALASPDDRSIHEGEALWDYVGKNGTIRLSMDHQPYARSALNGVSVEDADRPEDNIRFLGFSRKTVKYDAKSLDHETSDDPVAVVAGHKTVFNTGEGPIRPGDALEWYIIPEKNNHRNQIRDGVTMFSPNRLSLGLRPLMFDSSVKTACKSDKAFDTLWSEFHKKMGLPPNGIKHDDGVFDSILWAIQHEIAEAYQWCSGVATQNAPNGMRFDEMFTPFMKIGIKPNGNVVDLTVDPVVSYEAPQAGAPQAGVADPVALSPIEKLIRLEFPINFQNPETNMLVVAYNFVADVRNKKENLSAYQEGVEVLLNAIRNPKVLREMVPGITDNAEFEIAMWKIVALLKREADVGDSVLTPEAKRFVQNFKLGAKNLASFIAASSTKKD